MSSAVAFALGLLVGVTVHELAHALASAAQGDPATMYGFAVDERASSVRREVVTNLAGPAVSLVVGLLVLALPVRQLPTFWRLTALWTGLLAVQDCFGSLITGPFAGVGDVGHALELSGAPAVVGWLGFLVGWAGTALLGRDAVRRLSDFTVEGLPLNPQLRDLGLFAWFLGVGIAVLLSAGVLTSGDLPPSAAAFIVVGVLTSGLFLFFVRTFLGEARPRATDAGLDFRWPVAGTLALAVVAGARQLLLSRGIAF